MAICHCIRVELPIIQEFCTTYNQELQTVTNPKVIDKKFLKTIELTLKSKISSSDEQSFSQHLSQVLTSCFNALESVRINDSTFLIDGITYDGKNALSLFKALCQLQALSHVLKLILHDAKSFYLAWTSICSFITGCKSAFEDVVKLEDEMPF